jgi:hypothetical protein
MAVRISRILPPALLLVALLACAVPTFDYTLRIDTARYQIYERPSRVEKVVALLNNVAVLSDEAETPTLRVVYDVAVGANLPITFTAEAFPDLLPGSTIEYCMLLPWMRTVTPTVRVATWRLVIVTSLGQVYHNFPSRGVGVDGPAQSEDIVAFEESAVWDLPERRFPSKNPAATGAERYFPCLPDTAYVYHPKLNTDPTFNNPYRNGGFGKSLTRVINGVPVVFPRFYLPQRQQDTSPFRPMGGYVPGYGLALLGTYRSNTTPAARICVFASDDGGRNWFTKYEFANYTATFTTPTGALVSNWGNDINTSTLATACPANALVLRKRTMNYPSETAPNPAALFTWGPAVTISAITRGAIATVTTAAKHGLTTGNNIVIQRAGTSAVPAEWAWLANDTVSDTSGGTGVLFKVEVVDAYTVKLHEYIHNPSTNIPCRHIHHINAMENGWILGTGEEYPTGWIFKIAPPRSGAAANPFTFTRLTSATNCVQRSLGVVVLNAVDGTALAASDAALRPRDPVTMPPGRTETFSHNSTGVFRGKLAGLDSFANFEVVLESPDPAYFLRAVNGALVFSGQHGDFGISFDGGATWSRRQLDVFSHYYGSSATSFVADNYLFVLKR